jgi:hypothetical protein
MPAGASPADVVEGRVERRSSQLDSMKPRDWIAAADTGREDGWPRRLPELEADLAGVFTQVSPLPLVPFTAASGDLMGFPQCR